MCTSPEPLATLRGACEGKLPAWVRDAPQGSVIGVACSYAPLELLHAAGLTPVRLRCSDRPSAAADSWLPPFTCSVVRGILGMALDGALAPLAGALLPHTCDSMQELAGIWRLLQPGQWLLTPVEPLAVSPHALAYLRQELLILRDRLAERTGRPVDDEALRASISLYNRVRQARARVDRLRDRLSAVDAWAALSAAWLLPPEAYVEAVERLATDLQSSEPRPEGGARLLLAGSVIDEPLIPGLIDELGGRVVGDDLCNGMRDAEAMAPEGTDPWSALAARLLQRAQCPAKHAAADGLAERLGSLAARTGAQGVVQVLVKFCDPHAFDAVPATRALLAAGRPQLLLEVEAGSGPAQIRTRLQAFMELLAGQGAGG
ncbi:MAG: 2-hydroxyacyl-CoA dehydratase family protein [Anaerolineae bacterium]|nr:2-hydroxyacyl-CoA dehydratase family protein [Anaerolineae bacterium]